ncbi:MAG TPA: hypothetical protein VMU83_23460, partial [Hanamia sp.]|nr:hypothetical protein [Hanamia sp.]
RYNSGNCSEIKKYVSLLSEFLLDDNDNTFITRLNASVACRGLAMVSHYSDTIKLSYLEQAEYSARKMAPSNDLERIVAAENLYTCLLSLDFGQINTAIN